MLTLTRGQHFFVCIRSLLRHRLEYRHERAIRQKQHVVGIHLVVGNALEHIHKLILLLEVLTELACRA